ncbi:MAG: 50S ribosomal protein L10 [Candidatus Komeilibacteria bacterium]|nr:50S ribosomal protein L10 [Candidatus Komeilibacteria bacterium]
MAKTRSVKQVEVKKIEESFTTASSVVFSSYDRLTVAKSQILRRALRAAGVTFLAVKKTLLEKVLKEKKLAIDVKELKGSIALAFGTSDEVAPAKILANFAKTNEALQIQGGLLENKFITSAKVLELAALPAKLEMLAQTVRTIQAPISGFVNVLAGNLRGLVNALNAIKDSKN